MIQQTKGIVLRSIKYGETSLICSIFTRDHGVQSYLVQGVRTSKSRQNKAGLLQPATLLDLIVYQKASGNLQRIKEMQPDYIYHSLHEEVIKNSVALFSVELLLKLLPEHAPLPELYDFARSYFERLDRLPLASVANFPLYFAIQCGRYLGYDIRGRFSQETPHLNLHDGAFTHHTPMTRPFVSEEEAKAMDALLNASQIEDLLQVEMNATMRFNLLDWQLGFLLQHTQHLGTIKSLAVLRAILH